MPQRPRIAILFRYPIEVHEDLNNIFPAVLRGLAGHAEVHYFSYRSKGTHPLRSCPGIFFHEIPLRVRRQNLADKWLKTILWFLFMPLIGLWCRCKKVNLVYLEESMPMAGFLLRLFSGRPTVISGADMFWDIMISGQDASGCLRRTLAAVDRFCWRSLDGVISRTSAFRDHLITLGLPPERIRVVTESTEAHKFHPMPRDQARKALGIPPDVFVLVHHGLIQSNKALHRILQYIEPLASNHPEFRLLIAGDGPEKSRLERLVREMKLDASVQFLGWLPGTDGLNQLLNACDVSLVSREGRFSDHFQVTANLLHSLSCGCATLATRLRGISELVEDARNGLLFEPDDGDEFRAKLERLIRDPALRDQLGQAALRTAQTTLAPAIVTATWTNELMYFAGLSPKEST